MSIRKKLRADLLAPIAKHREQVEAIKAVPDSPASEAEFAELRACLVTVREDPESIPAVTDKICSQSVRLTAVAIHLTREWDQGIANRLTEHWDELSADTQAELINSVHSRLLILREQVRRVHAQSEEQIDETVDGLVLMLDGLPVGVHLKLTEAVFRGELKGCIVKLIKKLVMLQAEWPEMVESELESAL